MRMKNAFRNMFTYFITYIFLFVVGIVARRFLLSNFDTELVAYDTLIATIFSYVALVDFGIEKYFTYRLYKGFADNNEEQVNFYINMYRTLSIIICFAISIICLVIYFFLPVIFEGKVVYWTYFKFMFFLTSVSTIVNYYFGYSRVLLVASQMEYKAIRIETLLNFTSVVAKTIVLLTTKDYLFYSFIATLCTIIAKLLIFIVCKRNISDQKFELIQLKSISKEHFISESINIVIANFADTVIYSSSALFISILINVPTVALVTNYMLISDMFSGFIGKIIQTSRSSLANFVYSEGKDSSYSFFETFDFACFLLGSIILCSYFNVFTPAISVLIGNQYVLPIGFLLPYSIVNYIGTKSESAHSFRSCYGDYDIERKFAFGSIAVGIICPIVFSRFLGLGGIYWGMILCLITKWIGSLTIVYKHFNNISIIQSYKNEFVYFVISLLDLVITYLLCRNIVNNLLGIIISGTISVLVPLVINLALFIKSNRLNSFISFIKSLLFNTMSFKNH